MEPGAANAEIDVDRIDYRELPVDAVEDVELVALVVEDGELRRVEEAAGIQGIEFDEVAPVLTAIAEIGGHAGRPEGPEGCGDGAGGSGDALAGTGGDDDDDAGLSAVLSRWRSVDYAPCIAFPGLTQTQCDQINDAWHGFQVDLSHRSKYAQLRIVAGAGHRMHQEKSEAIAQAIHDVWRK